MKFFTMIILTSTALAPAVALAQGAGAQPGTPAQNQPGANQANQQGQTSQLRPIAVSEIQGKDMYTARGESVGEVERVILGQGNQAFGVVRFGEFLGLGGQSRIVPISRMMIQEDRIIVSGMSEAEFNGLQAYRENMAGYREAEPTYEARMQVAGAGRDSNNARANGSQIVLQQAAPTIRVNPAAPQVMVRQQQPQVTVNQAQPEIIVRQPQPTVRVDIPQPEIIVRMPEPDVNVALAQPQVEVRHPQPQVRVQQPPQQPQVQMVQDQQQPQVQIQRQANSEPNVQVQQSQGQPNVRYERAEPRVIVNQAQGQPNVRIERAGEGQQAAAAQKPSNQQVAQQRRGLTEQERQAARERLATDVDTTAAVDNQNVRTRPVSVDDMDDMDVYNARGEKLGDAERIVVDGNNKRYVVIGHGGFLGIGEDRVAFPLERFGISGDRLVIRGVTEEDIEAMDDYRDQAMNYRRLSNNDRLDLRVW
ncbi:PRC-barrel domain-containing protein [Microvirga arabica]|uniref:PRC-barrel domain-containing protein n=1 Tax=Microvirga arabica TaxID=1128671 RepID=A0ABV6YB96_9HYPH